MLFNYRKIYFIKKDFQSRFILRFVAIASVWAAATVLLFAYLAEKRLEEIRYSTHITIKTTSELLMPSTISAHVVSLLIFAGILAYTMRSLWQRLSVPLFTIKKELQRIAGGDLMSEVALREHDEFQDLAADLDTMRSKLRERIVRIKERQQSVSAAAAEINRSVLKGKPSLSHAVSLQSALERMKGDVHAFTY
jgi:methyl-accepting chemotaxis protein